MPKIKLAQEWTYDESFRLGAPGGFGEVFAGSGSTGPVAVKRLKVTAGAAAFREMRIGEALSARRLDHVVPVLDYGQDADSDGYYLVMPICDYSLQQVIAEKGIFTIEEARDIALSILGGLTEVESLVHRDLKPGNVLYFEGKWCLADFGIAKFVEDSTSLETLRGSLTPAYAAPEQWRGERPTHATDVYALGCIIHALINGSPPFTGDQGEVQQGHLHGVAAPLSAEPRLASFVNLMLRKAPEARPSIARCREVIASVEAVKPFVQHARLLAAANKISREVAEAEATAQAVAAAKERRNRLSKRRLVNSKLF